MESEFTETWYRGVVEDNNDPEQMGRVKVRIMGIHSEDTPDESVSSSHLPWAEVMGGTSFGLISGVGISSVLRQGTWVWVRLYQNDQENPVVVGTISGIPSSSSGGFSDPSGKYPKSNRLGVPDINEVARGKIETSVINKKNSSLFAPETSQSPSQYPNNNVIESESGHMIELDDTPGNERIQIIGHSGNYLEMKISEVIEKAVNNRVNLIVNDLLEKIGNNRTLTITETSTRSAKTETSNIETTYILTAGTSVNIVVGGSSVNITPDAIGVTSSGVVNISAPTINLN